MDLQDVKALALINGDFATDWGSCLGICMDLTGSAVQFPDCSMDMANQPGLGPGEDPVFVWCQQE